MKRSTSRGYTAIWFISTRIDKGQNKKATTPWQTQVSRSLRSTLSAKSSGTAAQAHGRNIKSDGSDIVQKTTRMNTRQSCPRISSDAIGPPGSDTMHLGPSERKGKQCNEKTRRKVIHSRLLCLTGQESLYTAASSSSSFISSTSLTPDFRTAWPPLQRSLLP